MRYLVCLVICFSCIPDYINTWDAWVINKNEHYSHRLGTVKVPSLYTSNTIEFGTYFDKSCEVITDDLNKLYGFTDVNSEIHDNSARIAWRWNGVNYEYFAYVYSDRKRVFKYLGNSESYERHFFKIIAKDNYYTFVMDGVITIMDRSCKIEKGLRFRCFPYFGGNDKAPVKMMVFVKELA